MLIPQLFCFSGDFLIFGLTQRPFGEHFFDDFLRKRESLKLPCSRFERSFAAKQCF